jgi:hypothetical protein
MISRIIVPQNLNLIKNKMKIRIDILKIKTLSIMKMNLKAYLVTSIFGCDFNNLF